VVPDSRGATAEPLAQRCDLFSHAGQRKDIAMSQPEDDKVDKALEDPTDEAPTSKRVADGRPLRESIKNPAYDLSREQMAELVRAISHEPSLARPPVSAWRPDPVREKPDPVSPFDASDDVPTRVPAADVSESASPVQVSSPSSSDGPAMLEGGEEAWRQELPNEPFRRRRSSGGLLWLLLAFAVSVGAVVALRPRSTSPVADPAGPVRATAESPPSALPSAPIAGTSATPTVASPPSSTTPRVPLPRAGTPSRVGGQSTTRDASASAPPPGALENQFE